MFKIKIIFFKTFLLFYLSLISLANLSSEGKQQQNNNFGSNFINTTIATSELIRQCSCAEESVCIFSVKKQIRDCFDVCWIQNKQINDISASPEQLKKCFTKNEVMIDKFIRCLKETRKTCVESKTGPLISRVNLEKLLGAGEKRLKSQAQSFLQKISLENQKLVESALNVGICVKSCLIQRDTENSCFDHSGCHPKLEEKLISPIIKRCGRKINWQKDLAEVCDCVAIVGFGSLKPYCMILHGHSDNSQFQVN